LVNFNVFNIIAGSLSSLKRGMFLLFFFSLTVLKFYGQASTNIDELLKPRTGVQKLVNDFTQTLTPDQVQALEQKLVAFDDSTSTQIAVVIINDLGGYDVADLNTKLGRAWGVGGSQFNNGVVLLIAKKERDLNIATGYGVEGALPDITAGHIIREVIVPSFKGNDFYRGIDEGTDAIMKAVQGEYKVARQRQVKSPGGSFKLIMIIILIIVFLMIRGGGNNRGGGFMSRRGYRGLGGPIFWPGGFGGGGSGGGFGGSGGGGGFGGFGGGSFGGGGASGSW